MMGVRQEPAQQVASASTATCWFVNSTSTKLLVARTRCSEVRLVRPASCSKRSCFSAQPVTERPFRPAGGSSSKGSRDAPAALQITLKSKDRSAFARPACRCDLVRTHWSAQPQPQPHACRRQQITMGWQPDNVYRSLAHSYRQCKWLTAVPKLPADAMHLWTCCLILEVTSATPIEHTETNQSCAHKAAHPQIQQIEHPPQLQVLHVVQIRPVKGKSR